MAQGAALFAASAYSLPPCLLTTSTPGCSLSHHAKVSSLLSGRMSTGLRRSRSTSTVPQFRPRLKAKSPTLRTLSVSIFPRSSERSASERVSGDRHSKFAKQPRPRLPAERERHAGEQAVQPVGAAHVMFDNPRQPFGEDGSLAGGLIAEEAPDAKAQGNKDALPGEVSEGSRVPRMRPRTSVAAQRTN